MLNRWAGPLVTALIVLGVGLILFFNLNPKSPTGAGKAGGEPKDSGTVKPAGFQEHPIGDEVLKEHMRIAAVWLPAVQMDGSGDSGSDIIHLEADVKATEGNPNGFARDEFVPYLKIAYKVLPARGGDPVHQGEMLPMVAADGLHYGASLVMPQAGEFRLVYALKPPSAGGLGRHSDPVTGVAPWWQPFEARFDWDYPGPPKAGEAR